MAKIDPKNHARVAIRTQYISPKCYAQSYSLQVLQILRYMIQVVNCLYHLLSNLPKTLQLHVRINALTFLFIYVFRNSDFCILENSLRIFFQNPLSFWNSCTKQFQHVFRHSEFTFLQKKVWRLLLENKKNRFSYSFQHNRPHYTKTVTLSYVITCFINRPFMHEYY